MVSDGKWTVRGMNEADRAAALAAAKRDSKPVALWLGEAIRAYVAGERVEVMPGRALAVIEPPALEDIARAVEIAERIATLRGVKIPDRFLARAGQAVAAHIAPGAGHKKSPREDREGKNALVVVR